MRILFLSNEFPSRIEPTKATFNGDLLGQLAREHEVSVVAPVAWTDQLKAITRGESPLSGRFEWEGRCRVAHPTFFYSPGAFRHHYGSFLWHSLRNTIRELARESRPDCVLSYWAHPDGECAVRLARRLGVPSLVMVGGSDVLLMTRDPRRRQKIASVLSSADAVMAVSRDLASKIVQLGARPENVHVLRRGVDARVFHPAPKEAARRQLGIPTERPMLVWIGRMAPVKGVDTLIEAFDQLVRRGVDAMLYLVGDGPLRAEITADIARRGLADRVKLAGSVPHEQLAPWFQAADATLLPSRSEGIPNVLLESLACGTPWIASRVGGIPEIAGHDATRLVPPNSPAELAEAIEQLLRDRPQVTEAASPGSLDQFARKVADLAWSLRPGAVGTSIRPASRTSLRQPEQGRTGEIAVRSTGTTSDALASHS
jgi:teichuronic acid biosynthesis glycosyltransferase TuaC